MKRKEYTGIKKNKKTTQIECNNKRTYDLAPWELKAFVIQPGFREHVRLLMHRYRSNVAGATNRFNTEQMKTIVNYKRIIILKKES